MMFWYRAVKEMHDCKLWQYRHMALFNAACTLLAYVQFNRAVYGIWVLNLFVTTVPFKCKLNTMDPLNTDLFHEHNLHVYNNILSIYMTYIGSFHSWTFHWLETLGHYLKLFIGVLVFELLRFGLNPFDYQSRYQSKTYNIHKNVILKIITIMGGCDFHH